MCVQRHYTIFGCSAHLSFFLLFFNLCPVAPVQLDASTSKVIYYIIIFVCLLEGGGTFMVLQSNLFLFSFTRCSPCVIPVLLTLSLKINCLKR